MASTTFQRSSRKSLTLSLTWLMTIAVFLVTVENVWIDPWLHARFPDFPSLAPAPPSPLWLATFAVIGVICVVLLVGQVLLARRRGISRGSKIIAGASVALTLALSVLWFCVTSGITHAPRL